MLTFGLITEGVTDRMVLENILRGYFSDEEEEPAFNPVQPPPPSPGTPHPPGGWTLVFQSLRRGDHRGALSYCDYLVIQIDTDVSQEPGFDVPWREEGRERTPEQLHARVRERLQRELGEDFLAAHGDRVLYAIAIHEIECWLLPLLYTDRKAGKIVGCLSAANHALQLQARPPLSTGETKDPRAYREASRPYLKRKILLERRDHNPSLALFLAQLAPIHAARAPAPPAGG